MNYVPFGLHDSHTFADLKSVSDQQVDLQVPSSAQGFHTQKTMHSRKGQIRAQQIRDKHKATLKVNDNVHHLKYTPSG